MNVERMELNNIVLDLRGNIRVFARVRPPVSSEQHKAYCGWTFSDDKNLKVESTGMVPSGSGAKPFKFDKVFDMASSQNEIFETIAPMIQSALDGFNVCIFTYGK